MSAVLEVAPMQWSGLKDIDDVEPLNEGDYDCLTEIRDVLKKYGKRERFGVALLHKHFDLDDGEAMMEVTDKNERVLTIKPVSLDETAGSVETIWMLMDGERRAETFCSMRCVNNGGTHNWVHVR